jgi:hypothetical protein
VNIKGKTLYDDETNNSKQEKLRVTNNDIIVMSLYFKYFQWSDFVPPHSKLGTYIKHCKTSYTQGKVKFSLCH